MADFTSGKNWGDFYSGILPPSAAAPPQPAATDWNQFYSGILPTAPASSSVASPYLSPAEQAQLQQQMQQSQALQAGYNPNGTPKPAPIRPSWTIPTTRPAAPTVTSIDQAAMDARNKPGTWMAQSRQMAQAGFRQGRFQRANGVTAPLKAQPAGGLFDLITGPQKAPAGAGGLAALVGGQAPRGATGTGSNGYVYSNGANVGKAPQYAGMSPSQMYDAINAAAGNRSSTGNSGGGNSMASSRPDGPTPDWVAHAVPTYDSQGNISGWQKNAK